MPTKIRSAADARRVLDSLSARASSRAKPGAVTESRTGDVTTYTLAAAGRTWEARHDRAQTRRNAGRAGSQQRPDVTFHLDGHAFGSGILDGSGFADLDTATPYTPAEHGTPAWESEADGERRQKIVRRLASHVARAAR